MKQIQIESKDFSSRKYYPGTPGHPFHTIDTLHEKLARVPFPVFAALFGVLVFLVSGQLEKSLIISGFLLLDWILLLVLPLLRVSFGPPTLTALALGMMRLPFLLFNFPVALTFQALGTALVLYGFYIEPQFPKISRYHMVLSKTCGTEQPIRIVHLSDLHMEYFTSREARAVEQINALSPDLILFSGDFFNLSYQEDLQSHENIVRFFQNLKSRHGTYAVPGSPSVDVPHSLEKLIPKLNLTFLKDQVVDLQINQVSIQIIGLACTHQPGQDYKRLAELCQGDTVEQDKVAFLLYHSPDLAPQLHSLPVDIQFSGHTHGGQVQIPFLGPIYTGSLYGYAFSSGHYLVNERPHLILSRGLGLEGEAAPRVRFFSPPEIGLISLEIAAHHVK